MIVLITVLVERCSIKNTVTEGRLRCQSRSRFWRCSRKRAARGRRQNSLPDQEKANAAVFTTAAFPSGDVRDLCQRRGGGRGCGGCRRHNDLRRPRLLQRCARLNVATTTHLDLLADKAPVGSFRRERDVGAASGWYDDETFEASEPERYRNAEGTTLSYTLLNRGAPVDRKGDGSPRAVL